MSRGMRSAALALAAVALAAAAFVLLRPDDPPPADPAPAPAAGAAPSPTSATTPAPLSAPTPLVRVAGGEPVGGVWALSARRGETVRFAVLADAADELHVHGYDRRRDLVPGQRAELAFPADLEGVFEVELHGSGALVAELTVSP